MISGQVNMEYKRSKCVLPIIESLRFFSVEGNTFGAVLHFNHFSVA